MTHVFCPFDCVNSVALKPRLVIFTLLVYPAFLTVNLRSKPDSLLLVCCLHAIDSGQNIETDISGCFFVAIVIITFKTIVKEVFIIFI